MNRPRSRVPGPTSRVTHSPRHRATAATLAATVAVAVLQSVPGFAAVSESGADVVDFRFAPPE